MKYFEIVVNVDSVTVFLRCRYLS